MLTNSFNIFKNKLLLFKLTIIPKYVHSTFQSTLKLNHLPILNNKLLVTSNRNKSGDLCKSCGNDTKFVSHTVRVGNYQTKWVKDRFITGTLLIAMPLALIYPTHIGDVFFVCSVMMHQHWGIEGIVRDYAREVYYGKTVPNVAVRFVRFLSLLVTIGLLFFTFTQCCIGESVRKFWAIKGGSSARKE